MLKPEFDPEPSPPPPDFSSSLLDDVLSAFQTPAAEIPAPPEFSVPPAAPAEPYAAAAGFEGAEAPEDLAASQKPFLPGKLPEMR